MGLLRLITLEQLCHLESSEPLISIGFSTTAISISQMAFVFSGLWNIYIKEETSPIRIHS